MNPGVSHADVSGRPGRSRGETDPLKRLRNRLESHLDFSTFGLGAERSHRNLRVEVSADQLLAALLPLLVRGHLVVGLWRDGDNVRRATLNLWGPPSRNPRPERGGREELP